MFTNTMPVTGLADTTERCIFCATPIGNPLNVAPGQILVWEAEGPYMWQECPGCGRWSPMPIDMPERLFFRDKLMARYAEVTRDTDLSGVRPVTLPNGATLIRVGAGDPAQAAAWRFGAARLSQVSRRLTLPGVADFARRLFVRRGRQVVARLRDAGGELTKVRLRHLLEAVVSFTGRGDWALMLEPDHGAAWLMDEQAAHVLVVGLARLNAPGATAQEVEMAVAMVEGMHSRSRLMQSIFRPIKGQQRSLKHLSRVERVAVEIAANWCLQVSAKADELVEHRRGIVRAYRMSSFAEISDRAAS